MENSIISDDIVKNQIYEMRGQRVILDRDLAKLYEVQTKVLKQSVKRNIQRFPEDFMFEMTPEEFADWRSQFVTSNSDLIGLRYAPFCFTEQGVAMLSSVLNSEQAIQVNIQIIRVFTKVKKYLFDYAELRSEIERLGKKISATDQNLELIFRYLEELADKKVENGDRKRMGYKPDNF